jgi:hypothetical protein
VRSTHVVVLLGISVSGALLAASCVESPTDDPAAVPATGCVDVSDQLPLVPRDESIGEAEEPWVGAVAAFLVCELAGHLAGKGRCEDDPFWRSHCPAGQTRIVRDVWKGSGKTAAIACDKARELTCDLEGGLVGFYAYHLICGAFL